MINALSLIYLLPGKGGIKLKINQMHELNTMCINVSSAIRYNNLMVGFEICTGDVERLSVKDVKQRDYSVKSLADTFN